ncbi:hypothetical protein [Salinicola aestuarinus]|uniref:hypothetical protein n=1 Tax=Salinicola aestuarinus TaxID=1949082 RepID=UPI000DA19A52|nr:hypothetical protein [Salinicola aestuarinus]
MSQYVVRHSTINASQQAPEWLVVDERHDEVPDDRWIQSRHAFEEEAEMEAERLNGDDDSPIGSVD